jgi:nucleoside-diphosphate-sugar epimerase
MSRFLITGAAGFIGASLAHALVAAGEDVRGIDDLSNGSLSNLRGIEADMDLRCADIRDQEAMREACRGVDYVLHHAAIASVPQSVKDPRLSNEVNVTGTLNLLLAARDAGVQRVVFAASSAAYGSGGSTPRRETMPPMPLSPYAVQKVIGEAYVQTFSTLFGVEGVSLRYFNIFGPRQAANSPYSGVIASFIRQMIACRTPTIYGNGEQSRDFTFIDNVVSANILACKAPASKVDGRIFNIGTGESQSLNTLYSVVARMLKFDDSPRYAPSRSGDVLFSAADVMQARLWLDYDPQESFASGLRKTIAWYLEQDQGHSHTRAEDTLRQEAKVTAGFAN